VPHKFIKKRRPLARMTSALC